MKRIWITLALVCSVVSISRSQPPSNEMDYLGEILPQSSYTDLALEGNRLYASTIYGIEVLDVSDPLHPQVLGRAPTYGECTSIAVKDSIAYAADFDRAWYAFDCRNPEHIFETFRRENSDWYFENVRVFGNRLYACVQLSGLEISDLTNPARPALLNRMNILLPTAVWVQDTITYITQVLGPSPSLMICNTTDLQEPILYSSIDIPGNYLDDVTALDTLVFVAAGDGGVKVFNVSDPTQPNLLTTIGTPQWATAVAAKGTALYISDSDGGLLIYDMSDPLHPQQAFSDDTTQYWVNQVLITGNQAFLACRWDGWSVWNLDTPTSPQLEAVNNRPQMCLFISAYQNALYVPRYDEGLAVFNTTNPGAPTLAEMVDTIQCDRSVVTNDGWLYTLGYNPADSLAHLKTWDLNDPLDPQAVNDGTVTYIQPKLVVGGDVMAMGVYDGAIELWDISNREAPAYLTQVTDYPNADLYIDSNRLYVATTDNRLSIFDLVEPENPQFLGEFRDTSTYNGVCAMSGKAFLAAGYDGIIALNVSDPANIRRIVGTTPASYAYDVKPYDGMLYVSDYYAGLKIFDPLTFRLPRQVAYLETPGVALYTTVANGVCYIGDDLEITICHYQGDGVSEPPATKPAKFALLPAYPNPANGFVKVPLELPAAARGQLLLVDTEGRLVSRQHFDKPAGLQTLSLDLSDLPSGSYKLLLNAQSHGRGGMMKAVQTVNVVK